MYFLQQDSAALFLLFVQGFDSKFGFPSHAHVFLYDFVGFGGKKSKKSNKSKKNNKSTFITFETKK